MSKTFTNIARLHTRPGSLDLLRKPSKIMGKQVESLWLKLEKLQTKEKKVIIGAG